MAPTHLPGLSLCFLGSFWGWMFCAVQYGSHWPPVALYIYLNKNLTHFPSCTTLLDRADREHIDHCRKSWAVLGPAAPPQFLPRPQSCWEQLRVKTPMVVKMEEGGALSFGSCVGITVPMSQVTEQGLREQK